MEEEIVPKVWGEESVLVNLPDLYCAKYLYVSPGFMCSRHRHLKKHETFICIAGSGFIEIDGEIRLFTEGQKQTITPGTWHCFGSPDGMTLLEISTTHSDEDVERDSQSQRIPVEYRQAWELYRG